MARVPADHRVRQARSLASVDEARALYRAWANDYDRDIADTLKFTGGADIAALLAQHVSDPSARIIDLGCGTGLVAMELHRRGFDHLDGLDLSPEMLQVAAAKGLYRNLIEADMNQPLAIADGAYDAAVSAGTFTSGHVGAGRLAEVVRILRPGGVLACVIAVDVWSSGGFDKVVNALRDGGRLAIRSDEVRPIAASGDAQAHFVVARVNA